MCHIIPLKQHGGATFLGKENIAREKCTCTMNNRLYLLRVGNQTCDIPSVSVLKHLCTNLPSSSPLAALRNWYTTEHKRRGTGRSKCLHSPDSWYISILFDFLISNGGSQPLPSHPSSRHAHPLLSQTAFSQSLHQAVASSLTANMSRDSQHTRMNTGCSCEVITT